MIARAYPWFVVVFWIATMSWLTLAKVLPPLLGGHPPDYAAALAPRESVPEPVCWRIAWNDRRIGTAVSQVLRRDGGRTAMRHVVSFERLPLHAMLTESLGSLAVALKPFWGEDDKTEVSMLVATELRFTARRQFSDFHTTLDIAGLPGFLRLFGSATEENRLQLVTRLGAGSGGKSDQVLRHEIDLPRSALVSDAFAPRTELRDLHVGQKWTIPIYRPFPPNSPVQIVEAVASQIEVILWDGRDVETIVVEYRQDAGSGLHVSREPMSREWVRSDGTVLQQELRLSGLKLMFERLSSHRSVPETELLDSDKHARLWLP